MQIIAQVSSVYNFCCRSNSTKFIRMFNRQFSKGNNMGLLKINNGEIMRMRNILTLITSVGFQIQLNL